MALTYKQDLFCQNIVKGMTVANAYLSAYDSNAKPSTANVEGTRLLQREDVQERIKALQKPIEIKAKADAVSEHERKRSVLWGIVEDPASTNADRCRALDILNRMDQAYINITKTVEDDKAIDALDVETLRRLAEAPQDAQKPTEAP